MLVLDAVPSADRFDLRFGPRRAGWRKVHPFELGDNRAPAAAEMRTQAGDATKVSPLAPDQFEVSGGKARGPRQAECCYPHANRLGASMSQVALAHLASRQRHIVLAQERVFSRRPVASWPEVFPELHAVHRGVEADRVDRPMRQEQPLNFRGGESPPVLPEHVDFSVGPWAAVISHEAEQMRFRIDRPLSTFGQVMFDELRAGEAHIVLLQKTEFVRRPRITTPVQ